jgi:hypothetical protein
MPQATEATRFLRVWIRRERKGLKPLCLQLLALGQRPTLLAPHVGLTGTKDGATAFGSRSCCLSSWCKAPPRQTKSPAARSFLSGRASATDKAISGRSQDSLSRTRRWTHSGRTIAPPSSIAASKNSRPEVAEMLGLSVANAKTRVPRARLFLRQRLAASLMTAHEGQRWTSPWERAPAYSPTVMGGRNKWSSHADAPRDVVSRPG